MAKLCWHQEIFNRGNIGFQNRGKLEICKGEKMEVGGTSLIHTWTFSIITVHKHTIPKATCFHLQVRKDFLYNVYPGHLVKPVSDKPKNRV